MVSMKEYFGSSTMADVPITHIQNAEELLRKVNVLREAWNKPMIVTSGYRTMTDHLRIYSKKGIPAEQVPLKSRHLYGKAIDIADPDGSLKKWLKEDDSARLKALDLYCEEGTHGWCHIQSESPKSGRRWFYP